MNRTTEHRNIRELVSTTPGMPATDGDGVKMTRVIGSQELNMLDPFLLLDVFESDQPQDYIGGFPSHPHRGFETVTYLLAGRMRHKDSEGTVGVVKNEFVHPTYLDVSLPAGLSFEQTVSATAE